ncbi:MAG: hypothetical protein ACTSP3_12270 [Candidatus Heimdallarchaeaceae archaeon]
MKEYKDGELFINDKEYDETNLEGIEEKEKIKKMRIDCDAFCEKLDLSRLPEFENLEELRIRIVPLEEYYGDTDPMYIWPKLFELYPYDVLVGYYTEDDRWRDVRDAFWNTEPLTINMEDITKCKKLEKILLEGPRIEIRDFTPLIESKSLKKIRLQDVWIKYSSYEETEEEKFKPLGKCKPLEVIEIVEGDTTNKVEEIEKLTGKKTKLISWSEREEYPF